MDKRQRIQESGLRVAVICGGNGSEREVSLVSGKAIQRALAELELPCVLHELGDNRLPDGLDPDIDLVLPLIHGTYGEDGRLSAVLEAGGFAYGGSDQASSVICFDKLCTKALGARMGLPVARDVFLPAGVEFTYRDIVADLGEPFILKPRRDGSSVGLHLIRRQAEFEATQQERLRDDYLAEAYLEGIDLTVGILGREALGVVAVHPKGGLYDYAHKYTAGMSHYDVPAHIEVGLKQQLFEWSCLLFNTCGCRDLSRVDYRLGAHGEIVLLEINTLPGMTPTSLLPKAASCSGLGFNDLVLEWVGFALERMKRGGQL